MSEIAIEKSVRIEEPLPFICEIWVKILRRHLAIVKKKTQNNRETLLFLNAEFLPRFHVVQGSASTRTVVERRDHPVSLNVDRGGPTLWPMEGMGLGLRKTLRRVG